MAETVVLAADDGGSGDGLPVVFLHSLAGNTGQWEAQLTHLRRSRRAVALDWRGHGRSGAQESGDWSMEALAGDVAAAVDRLGLPRFVLVGHSAGGMVALFYAARHPERVAGLLLLDAAGDMRRIPAEMIDPFLAALQGDEYPKTIEGYWRTIAGPNAAVAERLMADLRATPRDTVTGIFAALRETDVDAALAAYRGPRLAVVTPANNGPFSLHNVDRSLPHRIVTGTAHWIQLEKPDEVNRMIDEFAAQVEQGGGMNRVVAADRAAREDDHLLR
ncbi:MAG TPA: alpha/beta fold hydrolase [Longimicrobium sp.]|nr:alpha/beta fold hydrolase [Longimicrobium sp.]